MLYLELSKAFYGMVIELLLLYQQLGKYLEAICYKVNIYDPCVENKMIHNKQKTITWHVEDLKLSHTENDIVNTFVEWTKETYDDVTELKPSRSKIHDYITMTLDYTESGEVKLYVK